MTTEHLENYITHSVINGVIHGAIYKAFREMPLTEVLWVAGAIVAVIYLFIKFKK